MLLSSGLLLYQLIDTFDCGLAACKAARYLHRQVLDLALLACFHALVVESREDVLGMQLVELFHGRGDIRQS
jgi:hypothetical protein